MSDKTLVERLRESAKFRNDADCTLAETLGTKLCEENDCADCCDCTDITLNALADAIEREYLPRPTLVGKTVNIGDAIDGYGQHDAKVEAITDWGGVIVRSTVKGGSGYHDDAYPLLMWDLKNCKRPAPEVLDADGVPIRVGDTVWYMEYGVRSLNVIGIVWKDGEARVKVIRSDGQGEEVCEKPSNFTHIKPDDIELIERDAQLSTVEYTAKRPCPSQYAKNVEAWMRLDLLRRQREVLDRKVR